MLDFNSLRVPMHDASSVSASDRPIAHYFVLRGGKLHTHIRPTR